MIYSSVLSSCVNDIEQVRWEGRGLGDDLRIVSNKIRQVVNNV